MKAKDIPMTALTWIMNAEIVAMAILGSAICVLASITVFAIMISILLGTGNEGAIAECVDKLVKWLASVAVLLFLTASAGILLAIPFAIIEGIKIGPPRNRYR